MRRRGWFAAVIAFACAVSLVLPRHERAALRGGGTSWRTAGAVSHRSFEIGGAVHGLYPGYAGRLELSVRNLRHFAIVVDSITTAVGPARNGCGASYLKVWPFSGHVRVLAHGTRMLSVSIKLSHAAPDACQGARFPLRYSGWGRRA
jgi:hypothetical protein